MHTVAARAKPRLGPQVRVGEQSLAADPHRLSGGLEELVEVLGRKARDLPRGLVLVVLLAEPGLLRRPAQRLGHGADEALLGDLAGEAELVADLRLLARDAGGAVALGPLLRLVAPRLCGLARAGGVLLL